MTNTRSLRRSAEATWHPTLFSTGPPSLDPDFGQLVRHELAGAAWVDHVRGWMGGADEVFDRLVHVLAWTGRTVPMYGELKAQPRLTAPWPGPGIDPVAGPLVEQARTLLSDRYQVDFDAIGASLYRDGADSVAWHGDRVARERTEAVVAIISLGDARPFRLRPTGGGHAIGFALGHGDLLVMGGSCQRTWQHAVPKVRLAGPRLSLSLRHAHD